MAEALLELQEKIDELIETIEGLKGRVASSTGEAKTRLEMELDALEKRLAKLEQEKTDLLDADESEGEAAEEEADATEVEASRLKKAAAAAKKAGAATAAAASAVAGATAAAGKKAGNAAVAAGKTGHKKARQASGAAMRGTEAVGNSFKENAHPWGIALVALAIHLYDVINNFSLGASHRSVMLILYTFFTLWIIFFYYKTGLSNDSWRLVGISLLAFALPYIKLIPVVGGSRYLLFFLFFFPIWFMYIALNQDENPKLNLLARLILIFLIASFIFLLLAGLLGRDLLPDVVDPVANVGSSVKRVLIEVKDAISSFWERFKENGLFSPTTWQQRINNTFNPYAQFYAGQVEQGQEPTGVFITDLKSLYPTTFVGASPVIIGRLEAKSFLQGGLQITPSCVLERAGKGIAAGAVEPAGVLDVNYRLVRDVTCEFPSKNLTAGVYYGVLRAAFQYETWAYITETFVSRDLIEQLYRQGQDPTRALDIDPTSEAIYTNGPMMIGVESGEQPIDIDLEAAAGKYVQRRFGFTVANRWSQGEGARVDEIKVIVPKPFTLDQCQPSQWSAVDETAEYRNYTFSRAGGFLSDPRFDYSTINCQLVLERKEDAEQVLAFGEKTPVTFVVLAKYHYTLEKKVPVRVDE